MKRALALLRSAAVALGPAGLLLVTLGVLALAAEYVQHRRDRVVDRRVIQVEPTRRAESWDVVRVPADLVVPEIPEEDLVRLRDEYHRPDLRSAQRGGFVTGSVAAGAVVLGEDTIQPLPHGGTVLKTLEADGTVGLTIQATPPRFVDISLRLRPYVEVGRSIAGERGGALLAGVEIQGLRIGRLTGAGYVEAGRLLGYDAALAGVRVYFGGR